MEIASTHPMITQNIDKFNWRIMTNFRLLSYFEVELGMIFKLLIYSIIDDI